MRTLFIGVVHGCADELDALLKECGWRQGERVDWAGLLRRTFALALVA